MARVRPSKRVLAIRQRLAWAVGGEWSVPIRAEDCAILLAIIDDYYARLAAIDGKVV